ncbi:MULTISPECIES: hypothetical protein [unclassified Carboxylicivirga]|uniref:hypothetical protein n=1 Tax=Carboxylicivirga TaxID=1628153 RepID=UPI003D332371
MKHIVISGLIEKVCSVWSDIDAGIEYKASVLKVVNNRLAELTSPQEENFIKIEIVRAICRQLKLRYPNYAKAVDDVLRPFEWQLQRDQMAVLPFKQIDTLTYRIYMQQTITGFAV